MQMEPQLMSLPSFSFPPLWFLPSLVRFFFWVFLLAAFPMLCRYRNLLKLSIVNYSFSSYSPSCFGPFELCTEGDCCGIDNCS